MIKILKMFLFVFSDGVSRQTERSSFQTQITTQNRNNETSYQRRIFFESYEGIAIQHVLLKT